MTGENFIELNDEQKEFLEDALSFYVKLKSRVKDEYRQGEMDLDKRRKITSLTGEIEHANAILYSLTRPYILVGEELVQEEPFARATIGL